MSAKTERNFMAIVNLVRFKQRFFSVKNPIASKYRNRENLYCSKSELHRKFEIRFTSAARSELFLGSKISTLGSGFNLLLAEQRCLAVIFAVK